MCNTCFDIPVNQLEDDLFTQEEQNVYVEAVYLGAITKDNLSLTYHEKHSKLLTEPIQENLLGPAIFEDDTLKADVARSMRTNVYEFSAAKQYQQVREMSTYITEQISFDEFKQVADQVFDTYNKTYLRTEFDTAIAETQNANAYVDAVEGATEFPLIQYKTQNDGRVRPAHAPLNGITLPANHSFWHKYWPANGWNCRCFTIQLRDGRQTDMKDVDFSKVNEGVPPLFRRNAAIEGEIFDKSKHPYWNVAKGDTFLKENNFNLPRG